MIGIIGEQDDIIGFGLTGIDKMQELPPNAQRSDVLLAREKLGKIETLIIPRKYHEMIQDTLKEVFVIDIPGQDSSAEHIAKLAKELLGITI